MRAEPKIEVEIGAESALATELDPAFESETFGLELFEASQKWGDPRSKHLCRIQNSAWVPV